MRSSAIRDFSNHAAKIDSTCAIESRGKILKDFTCNTILALTHADLEIAEAVAKKVIKCDLVSH